MNDVRAQQQPPSQQQQPQPSHFDHREALRAHAPQSSPRIEHGPEQQRPQPARTKLSPSPKFNLAAPNQYAAQQTLPQLGPPPQHGERPTNGAAYTSAHPPLAQAGPNGPGPNGAAPAYGRPFTPPTEIRPIREERQISPGSTYPHPQYHHPPAVAPNGGIAGGAPAPAAALSAAEAAAREREERPASAMKRGREWEGEPGPSKKLANEDSRSRLEEAQPSRRASPGRIASPRDSRRRSSSEFRREEQQRRAQDSYQPSEAAHHPPTLPSIQHHMTQPQQGSTMAPMSEGPQQSGPLPGIQSSIASASPSQAKEERERERERERKDEPPARKMEVDEDYDDDGEDDKKTSPVQAKTASPKGTSSGPVAVNGGHSTTPTKSESTATA